jgi:glutamate/aspartate transport system substrate-binding protein
VRRTFALLAALPLAATLAFAQPPVPTTLQRVKQSGVVRLGYREDAVPFSFMSSAGAPQGYSIELCQAIVEEIAEAIGAKPRVEYRLVTPTNRIDQVASGRVDLECGSTTISPERGARIAFSPVIFAAGTRLLVKRGSAIHSLRDLEGLTVAGVAGTTNARAMVALAAGRVRNLRITTADSYEHALAQLGTGAVDAVAADDILMVGLLNERGLRSEYLMVGDPLTTDPYGIAFAQGDAALAEVVRKAFVRLAASGRLRAIYAKWFVAPLPSGVAIGIPMSAALEKYFRELPLPAR